MGGGGKKGRSSKIQKEVLCAQECSHPQRERGSRRDNVSQIPEEMPTECAPPFTRSHFVAHHAPGLYTSSRVKRGGGVACELCSPEWSLKIKWTRFDFPLCLVFPVSLCQDKMVHTPPQTRLSSHPLKYKPALSIKNENIITREILIVHVILIITRRILILHIIRTRGI